MEQLAGKYTGIFVSNYIIAIVELFLAIILCELIAKIINNTFPFIIGKSLRQPNLVVFFYFHFFSSIMKYGIIKGWNKFEKLFINIQLN